MKTELSKTTWTVGLWLKLGVIVSAYTGIASHFEPNGGSFMGSDSVFLYYTIQSNIAIAAICLIFLVIDALGNGHRSIPNWLYAAKFTATVGILLTFLVFSLLLIPLVPPGYLTSKSNIFLHNLAPLLALADFLLCDTAYRSTRRHTWLGLILPGAYLIEALALSFAGVRFSGKLVPYFFLDYQELGWLRISAEGIGVVYWVLLLNLALLGIGFGLLWVKEKRKNAVGGRK